MRPGSRAGAEGARRRTPLKPADYWQLYIVDEGAPERGHSCPTFCVQTSANRLLCEIARLVARAKQRESLS